MVSFPPALEDRPQTRITFTLPPEANIIKKNWRIWHEKYIGNQSNCGKQVEVAAGPGPGPGSFGSGPLGHLGPPAAAAPRPPAPGRGPGPPGGALPHRDPRRRPALAALRPEGGFPPGAVGGQHHRGGGGVLR